MAPWSKLRNRCVQGAWVFLLGVGMSGCERAIDVSLPDVPQDWVVEGSIEPGAPPVVFISLTQGYFDPVDASLAATLFLGGAEVRVGVGETWHALDEVCLGDLPPDLQAQALETLGLPAEWALGAAADFCVYTSLGGSLVGEVGKTYRLEILWNDRRATAESTLFTPVPLDDLRFQAPNGGTGPADSLGWIYARLSDPPTPGQHYRWFARRINARPSWDPLFETGVHTPKDADFVAPLGSAVEDRFFNGLAFEFNAIRGSAPGSAAWDDQFDSGELGFFKSGDTVVVKFCTIDPGVYATIASLENQVLGQGNPFSVPAEVEGNVVGARGLWAAYGVALDTLVCTN